MPRPIVKVIEVPIDAVSAYRKFTADMGSWWPLDSRTISFHSNGVAAKTIETDPNAGGQIVEIGSDGTRHIWGSFVECDAPNAVKIDFHMGQPKEQSTRLHVSFVPVGDNQTRIKLIHTGWRSYRELAQMMRDGYDSGWDEIFTDAFGKACET